MKTSEIKVNKEDLYACVGCGKCSAACPYTEFMDSHLYQKIRQIRDSIEIPLEDVWYCSSCGACEFRCPYNVEVTSIIQALRKRSIEKDEIPSKLQDALESMFRFGNPWRGSVRRRTEWTEKIDIEDYKDQDILWWVGCTPAYDERVQKVARALANLLNLVGVDYGILGNEERCCGNCALTVGEEGLFQELKEKNLEAINATKAEKCITTSPHCFNAFKNEYSGIDAEILHYTQLLNEIKDSLNFSGKFSLTVTYQDPCYLGRYNGIYDEPREILKNVPGLELTEMNRVRENSLCCGGGGGRIWMESEPEERLAIPRLKEALETGADVLATACPFCMLNFEDARKVINAEDEIKILDIAEIVLKATD